MMAPLEVYSPAGVGDTRHLQCMPGYQVKGEEPRVDVTTRKCELTGEYVVNDEQGVEPTVAWDRPIECEPIECAPLPALAHASTTCSDGGLNCTGVHGSTCHHTCTLGYWLSTPAATSFTTCTIDGSWTVAEVPPLCEPVGCQLPTVDNGYYDCPDTSMPPDNSTYPDTCLVRCNVGFHAATTSNVTCTEYGRIDATPQACVPTTCPPLSAPNHGHVEHSEPHTPTHLSSATYSCHPGYKLAGSRRSGIMNATASAKFTRTCGHDGEWTLTVPTCQPIHCKPQVLPAGLVRSCEDASMAFDTSCEHRCEGLGLSLDLTNSESTTSTCMADGLWSVPVLPTCVGLKCPPLVVSSKSMFNITCLGDNSYNTVCTYRCDKGARPITGDTQRTCTHTGRWTGSAPMCSRVSEPADLSVDRPAVQSSTKLGGNAGVAVASASALENEKAVCTHTFAEEKPWWRVDLGSSFQVKEVRVLPCGDCASKMPPIRVSAGNSLVLDGTANSLCLGEDELADVAVKPQKRKSNVTIGDSPSVARSFACGLSKARYITLQVTDDVASLSLSRVRVIGYANEIESLHTPEVVELSYQAEVVQADTGHASSVTRGRCTSVEEMDDPWLRIDLKAPRPVHNLTLRSASDPNTINYKFEVRVGNSLVDDGNSNAACTPSPHSPLSPDTSARVDCGGMVGRYVNIRTPGTLRSLSICDVKVMGKEQPATQPPRVLSSQAVRACTSTAPLDGPHRIIPLPTNSDITQVVFRTPADGQPQVVSVGVQMDGLSSTHVTPCGPSRTMAAGDTLLANCPGETGGKFVRISSAGWNTTLTTCEVEVWGYPRSQDRQIDSQADPVEVTGECVDQTEGGNTVTCANVVSGRCTVVEAKHCCASCKAGL